MEMIKLLESEDFTCNGKCSKCGSCCSNLLPLTDQEISNLKQIIKKRKLKPYSHLVFNGYDMTCPFLNEKNQCSIYKDRPYICKIYKCDKRKISAEELLPLLNARQVNIREEVFK